MFPCILKSGNKNRVNLYPVTLIFLLIDLSGPPFPLLPQTLHRPVFALNKSFKSSSI